MMNNNTNANVQIEYGMENAVQVKRARITLASFISIAFIGLVGFVVVLFVGLILLFGYRASDSQNVIELGDEISIDPLDYYQGITPLIRMGSIDIANVDATQPGTYVVTGKVLFRENEFEVVIEDTVSPEIEVSTSQIYVKLNKKRICSLR